MKPKGYIVKPHKVTPEQIETMKQWYREGQSIRDIAYALDLSYGCIHTHLYQADDITLRTRSGKERNPAT